MSIFPRTEAAHGRRPTASERQDPVEPEGVLARPIRGQIYLIDEEDLDALMDDPGRSALSGLVSRH